MKRMWRRGVVVALWAAVLAGLAGGEDAKDEKLPADLAQAPTKAVALVSLRPADWWTSEAGKLVQEKMAKAGKETQNAVVGWVGVSPDKIERLTYVLRAVDSQEPPLVFIGTTVKFDQKEVFARLVSDGKEMNADGKAYTANSKTAVAALSDRAFVFGAPAAVRLVLTETPDSKKGLAPAVRLAAGKHLVVMGFNPGALPPLPAEAPPEIAPFKPLLEGGLVTATLDLGKVGSVQLRARFPDAAAAAAGLKSAEKGRKLGLGFLEQAVAALSKDKDDEMRGVAPLVKELLDGVKEGVLKREGSIVQGEVRVKMDSRLTIGALMGAALRVRESTVRLQTANNLKQIAIAFYNYASTYKDAFPAQAIYTKDGKPGLSWRVMILPFLEQKGLYAQFKLDEAWDSPHNKKLIARMPKVYESPGGKNTAVGQTFYQGFFGKGAIFEGKSGVKLAGITDGMSNTFMIVEAGKEVPWTKPEDVVFDPAKKLPRFGGVFKGGFWALMCDGSVRFVSDKVSEKTLKAAITRNGGENLGEDWETKAGK